jgi:hypothetical protein
MEPVNDNLDPSQSAVGVEAREPWEKLPQESKKAWGAFRLYRDAEKRSFKSVAERLNCSPQNVFQWSSKYKWKLRCDAFDVEQDRAQRAEFARSRVRMRERHMQVARAMLNVAGHALREWADRIEQRLPLSLAPEQIALLTKCATELEHRTMGTEAEHRFAQIVVRLTDAEPLPDLPAPTDSMSAALCDDTTGEGIEDDRAHGWKNPPQEKLAN